MSGGQSVCPLEEKLEQKHLRNYQATHRWLSLETHRGGIGLGIKSWDPSWLEGGTRRIQERRLIRGSQQGRRNRGNGDQLRPREDCFGKGLG